MSLLPASEPRILVIRGGALGDFLLTLPAIRLLRDNFPGTRLEILGYKHIVELAAGRYYADATRSIEYGPVSAFFSRNGNLDGALCDYFAGFQQIVSYLFDPDGIFEANLRRAGAKNILQAFRKIDDSDHAARQLARPLESLALYLEDAGARVFLTGEDRAEAATFLPDHAAEWIALHPGSGSPKKNWPAQRWLELTRVLADARPEARFVVVGGEADHEPLNFIAREWRGQLPIFARDLPLPKLAAIIEKCALFLGHDSGISHLAAAVGTPSLLLFGATDPDVWRPANPQVHVVQALDGDLRNLKVKEVTLAVLKHASHTANRDLAPDAE